MKPLTERIENMLAELRGIVEAVNVTGGPWRWDIEGNTLSPYADLRSPTRTVLAPRHDGNFGSMLLSTPQDRAFIARSRTITPLMAEMLIVAVETMLRAHNSQEQGWRDTREILNIEAMLDVRPWIPESGQPYDSEFSHALTELVTKWEAGKL